MILNDNERVRVASMMLVAAVQELILVGGRDATIETLRGVIERIEAGAYAEHQHLAGHA